MSKLINLSFQEGLFPSSFKSAQVFPLIKKPNLDDSDLSNFRPISNLTTISKIIERIALKRLLPHITSNSNFTPVQSAYRAHHSTETALLHVLDYVYNSCNSRQATILAGLDLSAAFDTINHAILLDRLNHEFGIEGTTLSWITSYLTGRSQYTKIGNHISTIAHLQQQGSVLGPLLFTTYISPISSIINSLNLCFHHYADDTQIFLSIDHKNPNLDIASLTSCINSMENWFFQNSLQFNSSKTEIILLGTAQRLITLSTLKSIKLTDN